MTEGAKGKVLLAEDEPHILRLLELQVQRAGFEAHCAKDGQEALELLKDQSFDLLIMDVMMPYVDGLSVLRTIRADPKTKDMPVAILTVKAQERDLEEGYQSGADLYLTKPFDPDDVQRALDLIVT